MSNRAWAAAIMAATVLLALGWLSGRTGEAPPPSVEVRPLDPIAFVTRFEAMLAAHKTGETGDGAPVVRPPAGDIYMRLRRWEFTPALELAPNATYRLHLMSDDVVHTAAIGEAEILVDPGHETIVTVVAPAAGRLRIQCGEYCGLGHTKMIGSIEVVR